MKQSREKAEQKLRDIYGQAYGFTIQLTETHKVFGDLGTLFTIEIPDILLNQMKWKTGDYLNISIKDDQIVIRRPSALEIFK